MEEHGVVPDVISVAPKELVEVTYQGGLKVVMGQELRPRQVKDAPAVNWSAQPDSFYTLCMVDPDAPSRESPAFREILHWMVSDIPGSSLSQGSEVASYIGSGPPLGSGLHRYIFLIYKQKGKLNLTEAFDSREKRIKFSIQKFAEKYDLGNPIFGNFYQAQYDDYVPILQQKYGQKAK